MISSSVKFLSELWNACAVPSKLAVMVAGSTRRAVSCTMFTASPSATPGLALNETVTEGNWPE